MTISRQERDAMRIQAEEYAPAERDQDAVTRLLDALEETEGELKVAVAALEKIVDYEPETAEDHSDHSKRKAVLALQQIKGEE